ncbi:conserved hypothetical protein [delta proteobacterium NaphS2]|nr:conserved hypothetical protein [delta proteobacterium NaphS2]
MSQGPFDSNISDTINRMSETLPVLASKSGQVSGVHEQMKAIHVRRNFQNYGPRKVQKGDIEAEKSEILNLSCSNKKIRDYIQNGTPFHFDYYDKSGLFVASTVVDQSTCQRQSLAAAYGKVKKRDGVYLVYANGIVKDTRTNLQWLAGPDRNVTWDEADRWVKSLGEGWRMPTLKELEGLYHKGAGPRNMTPLLETTGWWVWSCETVGKKEARSFSFGPGFKGWIFKGNSASERAFAVRSPVKE